MRAVDGARGTVVPSGSLEILHLISAGTFPSPKLPEPELGHQPMPRLPPCSLRHMFVCVAVQYVLQPQVEQELMALKPN